MQNIYQVHSSAIIDSGANIGEGCKIWHWTHVSSGAVIGENSSLGQNVYISSNVRIGKNAKIQNNVSIYDSVTIEDDVFCGPSMVFTNVLNPRSQIMRKNEYLPTLVKKGATLGANCTIVCGITIGQFAFIAAGAVVTRDVKNFALIVGIPGKQIGWMSIFGERIPLPLRGKGEFICPHQNVLYRLVDENLLCEEIKEN